MKNPNPNPNPNTELIELKKEKYCWVVTGAAGFIGSNLVEKLLTYDQKVIAIDNFSTGYQRNLDEIQNNVSKKQWDRLFSCIYCKRK